MNTVQFRQQSARGRARGITTRFVSNYWHLVISAAVAAGLVIAADVYFSRDRTHPAKAAEWSLRRPTYGPASFGAAIAASDKQIGEARDHVRRHPEDWLRQEGLARALIARSRLTGRNCT